jgi:ferric-dicitrate binding protein FerR (iron transport regulator)
MMPVMKSEALNTDAAAEIPEELRRRLALLPDFEAPPGLLAPRTLPRQRPRWVYRLALAAGLAAVLLAWPWPMEQPALPTGTGAALDQMLADARPAEPSREAIRVEMELAAIDARVQLAFEVHGDAPSDLWTERAAVQRDLLALYRRPNIVRL